MNTNDALHICRLVKACCPSQAFDEYTADAWSLVLSGYSFADAKAAVASIVSARKSRAPRFSSPVRDP